MCFELVTNSNHPPTTIDTIMILYHDSLSILPITTNTRTTTITASIRGRFRNRRPSAIRSLFTLVIVAVILRIVTRPSPNDILRQHVKIARSTMNASWIRLRTYDWKSAISFRVTYPMRVSIALSLVLGVVLGAGVGILSGLEPAVVIGVSASMALGCVFVMSFAIVHGVNVLRATAFAIFVSACLPLGFGVGFGFGILAAVFMGIEHPDDVRDKTSHFVHHFSDFARVVLAFTLEIL